MKYDNANVRRQDRLLDEQRARQLLQTGEYGVLSMTDEAGVAYGIPINFVYDGNKSLYMHCAPEGRKRKAIAKNAQVSFCIVGHTQVLSSKFTTNYESVVLSGNIRSVQDEQECWRALRLFLEKYAPNDLEQGMRYSEKSFHRTSVLRLDIDTFSGKTKNIPA